MPTSNLAPAPKPVPAISLPYRIILYFLGAIVLLLLTVISMVLYGKYIRSAPADVQPVAASAAPAPVRAQTPLDKVMQTHTMRDAYLAVQEYVTDTVGDPSLGAQLLGVWAGERATWYNVQAGTPTTIKLAKKDPAEARGSTICVTGTILQIKRNAGVKNLFYGTMGLGRGDFAHFFAAGPTGNLVDGDRAKFCGMFTGTYSFANVSGGETQAVQLVGMFDPTNT